jgi:hypothetical protein
MLGNLLTWCATPFATVDALTVLVLAMLRLIPEQCAPSTREVSNAVTCDVLGNGQGRALARTAWVFLFIAVDARSLWQ